MIKQKQKIVDGKKASLVINMIFKELRLAESKHPGWPNDPVHSVAILTEEVGEAMKEAIDIYYTDKGNIVKLRKELAQCGAMAIRSLFHTF